MRVTCLGRSEAKRRLTVADLERDTAGIEFRKDACVLDEAPAVYKSIDAVMKAQRDLVEVVYTMRQVVCVKRLDRSGYRDRFETRSPIGDAGCGQLLADEETIVGSSLTLGDIVYRSRQLLCDVPRRRGSHAPSPR